MAPRIKRKKRAPKPKLVRVGKHFISPNDVRGITQVRDDLYIVKFYSEPNPNYPCWIKASEIGKLLEHFEIVDTD
jgi:hypothetical protein